MNIEKLVEFMFNLGVSLGSKLLGAFLVLVIGLVIIKFVKKWIKTSKKLNKVDDGVRTFASSASGIALTIILFITVAMILGIPTTSFITALASCGVAIGLALQGSLSNFAGGLMLLIFKPFKVGDYIDANGVSGTVTSISVVYTVLCTPDNKLITVPNGTLSNSVIQNYSTKDTRRVDIALEVPYGSDVEKLKELLIGIAESHPMVLADPEPFARMTGRNKDSLSFEVRAWCNNSDFWDVKLDLTEKIKKEFDSNEIKAPFTQIDVHIDK